MAAPIEHESAPRGRIDFETRSYADLKKVGVWRYAEDVTTEIICLAYKLPAFVHGPKIYPAMEDPKIWAPDGVVPGYEKDFPQALLDFVEAGGVLCAHNAAFEQAIWYWLLHKKKGMVMPRRWRCSMAVAAYRSLPMSLDEIGDALDLDALKDTSGKKLLQKVSKPRKPTKKNPEGGFNKDPDLLRKTYKYCKQDVRTEEALSAKIGDLPPNEYRVWVLDQVINRRGVKLDLDAVRAAIRIVEQMAARYCVDLELLTGGQVASGTEVAKIMQWLEQQDYPLPDLTADTVKKALGRKDAPDNVARVLRIRQVLGAASTKKLYAMLKWVCHDGYVRGMLQYHGAGTGRWAGRGPQPQNFPRGDEKILKAGIETLINAIKTAEFEFLEICYKDPTDALKSCLRGMFIVEPDETMYVVDFSAIEARMTAWMAGEEWKLEAFRAIDRGEGYKGSPDIYCATAASMFSVPVTDKKDPMRQKGKIGELAFGYQGSVGAWRGFDKREPWEEGYIPDEQVKEFCDKWREAHPAIKSLWWNLDDAAVQAVDNPGMRTTYRSIDFEMVEDSAGPWLNMVLPNGRRLWYYKPFVTDEEMPWGKIKRIVNFWGTDNKKGNQWTILRGYGGLWTENAVQAASRDVMVEAMFRVEALGYQIILTVHDEVVAKRLDGTGGSIEEFEEAMSVVPRWLPDFPLAVDGWAEKRYRK